MVNFDLEIDMQTKGTLQKRVISGKSYFYHQYLEDGKQVSRVISEEEAYDLAFSIYRKEDIKELEEHPFI